MHESGSMQSAIGSPVRESIPDLTHLLALEAEAEPDHDVDEPRPEPPKPPPPPPRRRPSGVDFESVLEQHPPPVRISAETFHRRAPWASRRSLLRLGHREAVRFGVRPWMAYGISAALGAGLALSLYFGLV